MHVDPSLLTVTVNRRDAPTLTRQIYQQVRELILAGRLKPGARLASTRGFANEHGVSRTVVLAAYDQLVAEGYLEPRRGSGVYVAAINIGLTGTRVQRAVTRQISIGNAVSEGCPFDVATAAVQRFPHTVWTRLLAAGWRRHGEAVSIRPDAQGLMALREAIAHHLQVLRGVSCDTDQIVITEGHADALALVAGLIKQQLPRNTTPQAWVEDPGHIGGRGVLVKEGLQPVAVPVDAEGLQVRQGERRAPRAKLALVTPARQFPVGVEMSLNRRLALLSWARRVGALIVEDDYDCDLRFEGRPLASLLALDTHACVATIGSFSKTCFPGLRLGYLVAAPDLADALAEIRRRRGITLACVAQPALAEFIASGMFARHLRALRHDIRTRREALVTKLRTTFGEDLVVQPHDVGTHVTVLLGALIAARTTDLRIASAAAKLGLHVSPLSKQYVNAKAAQGLLLGYGGWSIATLERGVETLATAVTLARKASFQQ